MLQRPSVVGVIVAVCAVTILVQVRALVGIDTRSLQLLDAARPVELAGALYWVFRSAFVQVDLLVAGGWVAWLLVRRRELERIVVPALFFLVVAVQIGLRLIVNQPAPDRTFAFRQVFGSDGLGRVLDQGDDVSRTAFQAATTTPQSGASPPSFPSGHSARALFLALAFVSRVGWPLRDTSERLGGLFRRLAVLAAFGWAGLVGYSTLYFGYHWPSDVLAGYLLAIGLWQIAGSARLIHLVRRVDGRSHPSALARAG